MEQTPPPGLLWVDAYTDRCPLSGGPLSVMEVDLVMGGLGIPPITLGLGWSAQAACHLALLEDLFEMSDEAGLPPWAATGFQIDGRAVVGAVYLTEPDVVVPWRDFASRMEAAAERAERPPPTAEEVGRLPRFDETWELAAREIDVVEVDGEFVPLHLVVVVDGGGEIRATTLFEGALQPDTLAAVVLDATTARPEAGLTAGRPARVRLADTALLDGLRSLVAKAQIRVEAGPTALADDIMETLSMVGPGGARIEVPLLDGLSDDDLQALVDASRGFFGAAPWTRLRGDRYLAARLDDGPWVYASVMGQNEEEHGLSLFEDWLSVCRFLSNVPPSGAPAHDALGEVGAVDGLTLYPLAMLHEADAARLQATGPPVFRGEYPVATRFTARAGIGPSAWPVELYTALATALPDVIARRKAATITSIKAEVETPQGRLALRYPATGTEALTGRELSVELIVEAVDSDMTPLPEGVLRVAGPAATRLPQANKAVREALPWGRLRAVEMDGHFVWDEEAYADDPAPTLDDLAGARSLRVWLGGEIHAARARRLEDDRAEVVAEVEPR